MRLLARNGCSVNRVELDFKMIGQQPTVIRASAAADSFGEDALRVFMVEQPFAAKRFHKGDCRTHGNLRNQQRILARIGVSHPGSFRGRLAITTMTEAGGVSSLARGGAA